jgi:Carboxypeptidase regulatory-like domain
MKLMGSLVALAAVLVSGFHGTVMKGPTVPVCRVDEPCTAPAQVTLVFRRAGHTYRTRSGANGAYRISLPAGYYTVSTVERIGITPNIRPHAVHVRRGHNDRLDFSIDTGIR